MNIPKKEDVREKEEEGTKVSITYKTKITKVKKEHEVKFI